MIHNFLQAIAIGIISALFALAALGYIGTSIYSYVSIKKISDCIESSEKQGISENQDSYGVEANEEISPVKSQITLFYEAIKLLNKEYYYDMLDFYYEPSEELKRICNELFFEDSILQTIISNLHPKASQQPDRFLDTFSSIKIKDIAIVSIDENECTCNVRAEASHWFYASRSIEGVKYEYFKYYDDICLTEKDLEKIEQKEEKLYQEIGEGKPSGSTITTEENHVFHLVNQNGIYKIKDFVFNITSFTEE